jgi:hypothetical protein
MRAISFIFVIFMLFSSCKSDHAAKQIQNFKASVADNNTNMLKEHFPGIKEQDEYWDKLIEKVTKDENYETIVSIFDLSKRTDGITAEQYSLDLFNLYKRNPLFYIESADKYFNGDFSKVMAFWINEAGDIKIDDIKYHSKDFNENPLVVKFILKAEELNETIYK